MPRRLPDEFFRFFRDQKAADTGDDAEGVPAWAAVEARDPEAPALPPAGRGIAPRMVVASVLGALLLGFGVGRIVSLDGSSAPSPGTTSAPGTSSSSPSATGSTVAPTLVPHDGPVAVLTVLDAEGQCLEGPSRNEPANLIDTNPSTFWRCGGSGTDEEIRFTLDPSSTVVGVRLVNGNTVWTDRYLAERRILSVRWTFSDGSWFVQGLAANDPLPQEVRFPPVTGVDEVTMTILDATVPGASESLANAVSISSLDFLTAG